MPPSTRSNPTLQPHPANLPVSATPASPGWSSEIRFTVAGAAALIGLGSPWELSYLAAAHGGGAFLLVYLTAIILIALPLLRAELVIGRRTGRAPADAMAALARRERRHPAWQAPGWIGAAAALVLLVVYGAMSGRIATHLANIALGEAVTGSPRPLFRLSGQVVFLAAAALVAGAGLRTIERTALWITGSLLLALGGLFASAVVYSGTFVESLALVVLPDFGDLGLSGVLLALRHACLTLGLGATVMMAYGAYLPQFACIPRSSARIAAADTIVSLLAGLAVMSFVIASGMNTAGDTDSLLGAMPARLGDVTGGNLAAAFFLVVLLLAAFAAAVALLEPVIAVVAERLQSSRRRAAAYAAAAAAVLGATPAIVDIVGTSAAALLVGIAAAGTALFAGRVISRRVAREELALCGGRYRVWWLMVRWAAPVAVGLAVLGLR